MKPHPDATQGLSSSVGHNNPPGPTPFERAEQLVANANRWIAERPEIVDAEQAGLAQGFVEQLRANKADLEKQLKRDREPFDTAIAALTIQYRTPLQLVGISLTRMLDKLRPWLAAEQQRIEREADQRQRDAEEAVRRANEIRAKAGSTVESELAAREAEQAAADATKAARKGPRRAQVKGDYSSRAMSMRATWYARVTDEAAALEFYRNDPSVRLAALEAATKLASALAREVKDAKRAPPGFVFERRETPQ